MAILNLGAFGRRAIHRVERLAKIVGVALRGFPLLSRREMPNIAVSKSDSRVCDRPPLAECSVRVSAERVDSPLAQISGCLQLDLLAPDRERGVSNRLGAIRKFHTSASSG